MPRRYVAALSINAVIGAVVAVATTTAAGLGFAVFGCMLIGGNWLFYSGDPDVEDREAEDARNSFGGIGG